MLDPQTLSAITQSMGAAQQALGAFYGAKSKQAELRGLALSAEHQAAISRINARAAGMAAERAQMSGRFMRAMSGLRTAQNKSSQKASAAARGVQIGAGSAAEITATTTFAGEVDALSIEMSTVQQVEAARTEQVNQQNAERMALVSASSAKRSMRSINPWLSMLTTGIAAGGAVASHWIANSPTSTAEPAIRRPGEG